MARKKKAAAKAPEQEQEVPRAADPEAPTQWVTVNIIAPHGVHTSCGKFYAGAMASVPLAEAKHLEALKLATMQTVPADA
jgi:hypothetical protein